MSGQGILIVGGYGVVRRRIAADLAPDCRGQVIIAGRSPEKAKTAAVVDYSLQELAMPFIVFADGTDLPARAFSDPRLIEFPLPIGARLAYLFPFSDQVLYPRTMRARTVRTRLA